MYLKFYQIEKPDRVTGKLLDDYLERGWYRVGPLIMTTDFIEYEGSYVPVFWIRLNLQQYRLSTASSRILRQNQGFSIEIAKSAFTEEVEALYTGYRLGISFPVPPTAREYLLDVTEHEVYDTKMILVRDNGKLIAAGFFDEGHHSLAGILNIFDPAYKKYSLGKLLILRKIEYAIQTGRSHYYPGYVSSRISKFDYKLFPDLAATEVLLPYSRNWYPFAPIGKQGLEGILINGE